MNISDLIIFDKDQTKLEDVFLNRENRKSIELLLKEYAYIDELHRYATRQ